MKSRKTMITKKTFLTTDLTIDLSKKWIYTEKRTYCNSIVVQTIQNLTELKTVHLIFYSVKFMKPLSALADT